VGDAKGGEVRALKPHMAINVRSVVRSTEFYTKLLGTGPCKVRAGYAKFDVASPPLNLTLNENPFNERGALWHLGIQVATTEDVLAVRDRWRAEGLSTRDEMQIVCGYALQDKSWTTDPDGNNWEVFVVLKDNLQQSRSCPSTVNDEAPACTCPNESATASGVREG